MSIAPPDAPPRILGLVEGKPETALSGVGRRLLDALAVRTPVVGCVDYQPEGVARLALAAATFRVNQAAWRARFHTSLRSHRALSRTLIRRLSKVDTDFDLALQVHGWVGGQPQPYALYIDQTRLMAARGWPSWLPLGRLERSRLLELERRMYADAAHLLVMGAPARESLIADYGVSPDRITIVGGGLMFDALPAISEPARAATITFVGREFARKGGDCLLRAFALVCAKVPTATLRLVGVSRAPALPGVVAVGKVASRAHMSAIYASTRVFCMPSRYEPYGFAFAEAMAHGVPCVGTTVQSIPEILDHGRAGLLVKPDDPHALAAALIELVRDDERAREVGEAGRERVRRCLLWEHVAQRAEPALKLAWTHAAPSSARRYMSSNWGATTLQS